MKKLLIFLMIAIPLVVILVVNLTVNAVTGLVSVSVDSISLNTNEIKAMIDEVFTLEATILPKNATNKDVIWQSTDESVARVDLNGNVSFVGFGNGYITATTVDGNRRATCYFYVTDTEVHQVMLGSQEVQNGNYFVGIDEDIQLSCMILPVEAIDKNVTYFSDDESIAKVDSNGLVHGIKEGRVKITAMSESKNEITSSVIVEVVKPVEQIVLQTEKVVTSYLTYQINYNVLPADASVNSVIYKSLNEDVAMVSPSGLVTFVSSGVATIELTSVEGQKRASIEVECTDGYATDLILDVDSIDKSINEGGMYISYQTIPQSVDVDVEFSSDNEDVVYVDDSGYVQFMGGGNTLIHAKIKKSQDEYVEKVVMVHIESPATNIILEDSYITASTDFKINPKSYPYSSTNKDYFYYSNDSSVATVDESGLVHFVKDGFVSVQIDVFANKEKNVKKSIVVTYTQGYPTDLVVEEKNVQLICGETFELLYRLYPENADKDTADIQFKIVSQSGNDSDEVIELLSGGVVRSLHGGSAEVEISCLQQNGVRLKQNITIEVLKKVEEIEILTGLEIYENEFVTCNPKVQFEINNLTEDATNQKILWKLESSSAIKSGDREITFNSSGLARITAFSEDGNAEKQIVVRYLKSSIIEAQIIEVPAEIEVGEEVEFNIVSILPSNIIPTLTIKASGQITSSEIGKVVEISDNIIRGVAGGTANIVVKILNLQFVYSIKVIRKAEEINVFPANITTTKDRIILQTEVLPVDTTNKEVVFEVENNNVALVSENAIIFKKNGVANIVAKATDDSNVEYRFTIEKIEKGTGAVQLNGDSIVMQIGEESVLNLGNVDFEFETKEFVIKEQKPLQGDIVIAVEDDVIKAVSLGCAKIDCILTNAFGEEKVISVEIKVVQICEDIEFNGQLDYVDGDFVTARSTASLRFNLLPLTTTNKNYSVSIVRFISQGSDPVRPYIENNNIIFGTEGTAIVEVISEDGGVSKNFRIKYTGGNAVDVELSVGEQVELSVGDEIEVAVSKWLPFDTLNKQFNLREISHSQNVSSVVEISKNTIKAVAGGESKIVVEISGGITKTITIRVLTKVESIEIDEEIVTLDREINLNPKVLPSNATNKALVYSVSDSEIAYLVGSVVKFIKAGEVVVVVATTDGSNITRNVKITSTFGGVLDFELNLMSKTINKNNQFSIFATSVYPTGAQLQLSYQIVSSLTNDGSENSVVEISDTGVVKAVYGGNATIRVSSTNYLGEKIFKDILVESRVSATSLNVSYDRDLQIYQSAYVTSKSRLKFNTNVLPYDASEKEVIVTSSDETLAVVAGDEIAFLKEGIVVISFVLKDDTNGLIKNEYSFYYTEGKLRSLELDMSDFIGKTITLDAGQTYSLKVKSYLPGDVENIKFLISNKNEDRIDPEKPVISFNDNEITALNGGSITFDLMANGIKVDRLIVNVMRKCSDLKVENTEVFVNTSTYQINARALPYDTYQTELKFEVVTGNASVDENGLVTLHSNGVVEVKVSSFFDEAIAKIIQIEYTKEVKRISFNKTATQIYFGGRIDLSVVGEPFNSNAFEVRFISSNERVASVNQNGRVFANQEAGEVTIRAEVIGKEEIFVERTFTIIPVVAGLSLELDEINDQNGIGGYRVWGNRFVSQEEEGIVTINTYKMNIKSIEPSTATSVKLVWKSSNEEVALVDENGLVTFVGVGSVQISVEPEVQYSEKYPVSDSYTFIVVDGINIYSTDELSALFGKVIEGPIVLQNNLTMATNVELKASLYGNGYLIDFTNAPYDPFSERVLVTAGNILIDNVQIRGTGFDENKQAALSYLENTPRVVKIFKGGEKLKNILIRNCILENGHMCVEIFDSEVKVTGCILRNSFSAGVVIERSQNCITPAEVSVDSCIFANSLYCSILAYPERDPTNTRYRTKLNVKNVYMYNWLKVDEFNGAEMDFWMSKLGLSAKDELKKLLKDSGLDKNYVATINGNDYIMLGIVAGGVEGSPLGKYFSFKSVCDVVVEDARYVKPRIEVTMLAGSIEGSLIVYTLTNTNTFISPTAKYEDDPNAYQKIKQPFVN